MILSDMKTSSVRASIFRHFRYGKRCIRSWEAICSRSGNLQCRWCSVAGLPRASSHSSENPSTGKASDAFSLRPPRGTVDLMGKKCMHLAHVEATGRRVAGLAGFEEIRTPIFEFTQVFDRSLGIGSDVVRKEMFCFADRSNNSLALRPENTAGIVRALLNRRNEWDGVGAKLFYHGPMFRYERPQHGRQRQFNQFGIEMIGHAGPSSDAEAVVLAASFLSELGLLGRTRLLVNSLGDHECRSRYSDALQAHFHEFGVDKLSEDTQQRLLSGRTLRILDSKSEKDQDALEKAPNFDQFMNRKSLDRFQTFLSYLTMNGVDFEVDNKLVRGLDYYSDSVFEFVARTEDFGAKLRPTAILAGGRYDELAHSLGYKVDIPAVGWAAGIERICIEREKLGLFNGVDQTSNGVFILPILSESNTESTMVRSHSLRLAQSLRTDGVATHVWHEALDSEVSIKSSMRKGYKTAERLGCKIVAVVGLTEALQGDMTASVKTCGSDQRTVLSDRKSWFSFLKPC